MNESDLFDDEELLALDPLGALTSRVFASSIPSSSVVPHTLTAPVLNPWQATQLRVSEECIVEAKVRLDPGVIREALMEDETLRKDFINILLENMKDEEAYNLVLKFFRTYFERMMDSPEDLYIKIKELKDENKALKEELDFWKDMYEPQTE